MPLAGFRGVNRNGDVPTLPHSGKPTTVGEIREEPPGLRQVGIQRARRKGGVERTVEGAMEHCQSPTVVCGDACEGVRSDGHPELQRPGENIALCDMHPLDVTHRRAEMAAVWLGSRPDVPRPSTLRCAPPGSSR